MKKKNIIAIVGIIILLLIIGGVIFIPKIFKGASKEVELINLTKEFYGYYYSEVAKSNDVEKFLKGYKDSGLRISLGDLEVYLNGKKAAEQDYSTFEKCDVDKTYATIYPKDPYGKKDIEVKVTLSCQK